ncbi:phage regulatory CII family protein [Ferrimonas futtsuensis]|uniref:phage regulatory CII family protein n=1 Tax=Ferrimonas futtsuensis TaxID=364764 RepID=UPI0003FBF8F5|nr:phage regulatory CII family protein [Ferrimonas futtsuensis]
MSDDKIYKFHKTLHAQSKLMGIDRLYARVDDAFQQSRGHSVKKSTFHNKINPDREAHKLNVDEFILVLMALKEENQHAPVLDDLLSLYGMRLEYLKSDGEQEHDYKSFMEDWMGLNKEHGDVQVALTSALSDYKISENELNGIKVELSEHIQALTQLRQALDSVCGKRLD